MVNITLIMGDAGTGKSYELANRIHDVFKNNKTFVVLAFTHSAVNTIYNTFYKLYHEDIRDKFMTIHKYFRINIITNTIQHNVFDNLDYMFIDEYSLISNKLMINIFGAIQSSVNNLIICGDYKQLHSVDISENVSYESLIKYSKVLNNKYPFDKEVIDAIQHFDNSILALNEIQNNLHEKVILTKQKRSAINITKLVNNIVFSNEVIDEDDFISRSSFPGLINNNGYVFIASKYSILQKIHDCVTNYETRNLYVINQSVGLKRMKLYEGQLVTITTNTNDMCNGDEYIFEEYSVKGEYILLRDTKTNEYKYLYMIDYVDDERTNPIKYFPIIPAYLTTFHKSQGKTYDNVIICVDDLFDFTMLYTGITRAREDVLFYTDIEYIPKHTDKSYMVLEDLIENIMIPT